MQDSFGLAGSIIAGKYRVEDVVGEGGFGVVYRGHHLGFDQPIAIKCLKVPAHFTGEARRLFIERFAEEGKLLFRLSEHRAIVRVFDHAVIEVHGQEVPYLVLEWLDGISLHDHLRERQVHGLAPMSELEALRLLRDPIDGLAFAHQLRVAHRDIKPENLFLVRTGSGTVTKLLDFGVAKLMEEADIATQYATATSSGFRAFSPQYGAPEQFFSKAFGQTGPWTDVHAIGLLLTELVTSRPAFDGSEFGDFYTHALGEARPTPTARGAAVTEEFEELCAGALALEPRKRYRSGVELLVAVDAHLQAAGAKRRAAPDEPARQRRRAAGVAAFLAVALAATGAWIGSRQAGPAQSAAASPLPAAGATPAPLPLAPPPVPATASPAVSPPIAATAAAEPGGDPEAKPADGDAGKTRRGKEEAPTQLAEDGAAFRSGDMVFVRRGKVEFVKAQLGGLSPGKATIDGKEVSLDDLSPVEVAASPWTRGAMALVASSDGAKTFLGRVTAVRGERLTLSFWNGRRMVTSSFPVSGVDSHGVSPPILVRAAWQQPLSGVLDKLRSTQGSPPPRPEGQPSGSQATSREESPCVVYCAVGAGHERGTPAFNSCLAGCSR